MSQAFQSEIPLNPIVVRWKEVLRLARKFKKEMFQDDADEAMLFFTCNKELDKLMWDNKNFQQGAAGTEQAFPAPNFRIKVGKVAELVELFGPTLYHRNPDVVVEPKTLEIPDELLFPLIDPQTVQQAQMQAQQQAQMAQQQGQPAPPPFDMHSLIPPDPDENTNKLVGVLMEFYLNFVQRENNKKVHSRRAIDEALIKGAGCLWTEMFTMYPGGPQLIGSFQDTIDNLLIDPDAETIEEAWWVARKRIQPFWEVADKFGYDHKYIREKCCDYESVNKQGQEIDSANIDKKRQQGKTNDLVEYWEIYSRMGFGTRLKGDADWDVAEDERLVDETLEKFGDNVYIAIQENLTHPLNFKTDHLHELTTQPDEEIADQMHEEKLKDVSWPIPFWAADKWPFTMIAFHEVPNNPWPMSHIRPGLGYLKFLNWVMSFLINRCRVTCRTVASVAKMVGPEIVEKLFNGQDFEVLEIESNLAPDGDVTKLVSFLKNPDLSGEVWKVIEQVFDLFEKATGMNGLLYGEGGGMRSAEEARIKGGNANIRSDDMSNKTEDALSEVAAKEGMAARWLLDNRSVAPVLGKRGAQLWEQFVTTKDFESVAREYTYRIEAGSTRKPNKESQAQIVQQAMQVIPPLAQMAENPQFNDLANFLIREWAKANSYELKDPLIPVPVPQPNPMQQKIEAEIEGKKQELQLKAQAQQQDLQMQQQTHQIDLQATQAKAQAETQKAGMEMQIEGAKAQQEGQIAQQKMQQEVTLSKLDMLTKIAEHSQDAKMAQQQHVMGMAHEHETHKQGLQQSEQDAVLARKQAKAKPTGEKK